MNFSKINAFFGSSSKNKDIARRKYILNVLLLASIGLSTVAFVLTFRGDFILKEHRQGNSTEMVFSILIVYMLFLWLSKRGHSKAISYVLIGIYFSLVSRSTYIWGTDTPIILLMYGLLIVMSGILISSRFSLLLTFVICVTLSALTYLNIMGNLTFQQDWKSYPVMAVDIIVFCAIFFIIATVSWLFNRESENALKRALASELALKKQRDTLAQKVEEKTKELRQEQSLKIAQLYQFAEFGKLASGIMHDLSNSVNLVSANLKQLERKNSLKDTKEALARANIGTKRLHSFIDATRRQVNNQDFVEHFSVNDEVDQVIQILSYKAKEHKISITSVEPRKIWTSGNSIKFHQLMCNLVSNAIDSYDGSRRKKREVNISLSQKSKKIKIEVSDFGKGISKKNLDHIFEPFFTTKGFKKGTGIGLSISHDIVKKDLKGQILVRSKLGVGSTFTVIFPKRGRI